MFVDRSPKNERYLKIALIALGIVLVVVMLAALFSFDIKSDDRKEQGNPKEITLAPEAELKLQEQIAPLIKAGDMKACDQIQNDMYRKVCVNNIALNKAEETKDLSYCQYLDDELIQRDSCERQILNRKAIEKEDKAVCAETKDEKLKQECENGFLFGLANKKQDPAICDQDTDRQEADQCWNGYYAQRMMMPTSDGKPKETDCSLFRGDDVKADCQTFTTAQKSNDRQKLMESCQSQKTSTFFQVCMMGIQSESVPDIIPEQ